MVETALTGSTTQAQWCGTRTYSISGMWGVPGPGIEPMSSALAGGLSTTRPPGKSPNSLTRKILQNL